jgi:hypothetical protein
MNSVWPLSCELCHLYLNMCKSDRSGWCFFFNFANWSFAVPVFTRCLWFGIISACRTVYCQEAVYRSHFLKRQGFEGRDYSWCVRVHKLKLEHDYSIVWHFGWPSQWSLYAPDANQTPTNMNDVQLTNVLSAIYPTLLSRTCVITRPSVHNS